MSWGFSLISDLTETVSSTVSSTAARIYQSVEETTRDLDREQQKFIDENHPAHRAADSKDIVAPWIGVPDEEALKRDIVNLSNDKRNFLMDPPPGAKFVFDVANYAEIAKIIIETDPKLEEMRFKLVPVKIKEFNFWRNYFYRVFLLKQAAQLAPFNTNTNANANANAKESAAAASSSQNTAEKLSSTEDSAKPTSGASAAESSAAAPMPQPSSFAAVQPQPTQPAESEAPPSDSSNEAKSGGDQWMDDIEEELGQLGVNYDLADKREIDDDWEKALEDELNSNVTISSAAGSGSDWEAELGDALGSPATPSASASSSTASGSHAKGKED